MKTIQLFYLLSILFCLLIYFYDQLSMSVSLLLDQQKNFFCSPNDREIFKLKDMIKGPVAQENEELVNLVRSGGYLYPPASGSTYNLKNTKDPSMGQSNVVKQILNYKRNGFFVECGALDGETRSNSLSLERDYGWQGLLIEADPSNFNLLLKKNRRAWGASCCLALHSYPHQVVYQQKFNMGKISNESPGKINQTMKAGEKAQVIVQCFPLTTLLLALNRTTVDYFSLDVEGHELLVLQTINFDLIDIKVLSVEFWHTKGGAQGLLDFMETKGYRLVTLVTNPRALANDLIFVQNKLQVNVTFPPPTISVNKKKLQIQETRAPQKWLNSSFKIVLTTPTKI